MNHTDIKSSEGQIGLLNLFAATINMPIVLYEFSDRVETLRSSAWVAGPEPYCEFIQKSAGGAHRCSVDECGRASAVRDTGSEELKPCWAGLYNQVVPITANDEKTSVMVYGEMQIDDEKYRQESLSRLQQVTLELGLDEQQAAKARRLLLSAKCQSLKHLDLLNTTLPQVQRWFYSLEQKMEYHIQDVSHEIATGLMSLMLYAEPLAEEAASLTAWEIRTFSTGLLHQAQALNQIAQNLSESYKKYKFEKHSLVDFLAASKQMYQAEAKKRQVAIRITLDRVNGAPPVLEVSPHHIQSAVNNLLHNAIKYSFRGDDQRDRFVAVEGSADADYYKLAFENYGVGILQDEIDTGALWRIGYQGTLTYGEFRAGAGKGLYATKKIVDKHKGHIEVESHQMSQEKDPFGQPHLTRFTVYLPYNQPNGEKEIET